MIGRWLRREFWFVSNEVRQTAVRAERARPLCGLAESRPRYVEREFTLEEANEAVEELRPVVERMVESSVSS